MSFVTLIGMDIFDLALIVVFKHHFLGIKLDRMTLLARFRECLIHLTQMLQILAQWFTHRVGTAVKQKLGNLIVDQARM